MKRYVALLLLCFVALLPTRAFAQAQHDKPAVSIDLSDVKDPQELQRRIAALADAGAERILAYDIDVKVNADNSLDVTESIRVHAAGIQIRRGIYRDFPTRYKDRYGNAMVVDFTVESLSRDGKPEPWFIEHLPNGERVNFGNDAFLQVPADYTYTLRYRTNRQIGFFADHDELYWNAIGTGWDFVIEHASVTVHLPQPVAISAMHADGFTGSQGEREKDFVASLPAAGEARWTLRSRLYTRQGLTIVLTFPKGMVAAPTSAQKVEWFLKDNIPILIMLATLAMMFGYLLLRWSQVGRDPPPGTIIARYEPPGGYTPAALRFIRKMNADGRGYTADLLALAVKGLITIKSEPKRLGSDKWTVTRTRTAIPVDISDAQRALLNALFAAGNTLEVSESNRSQFLASRLAQTKALEEAYAGRMFKRNARPVFFSLLLAVGVSVLAYFLSHGNGVFALVVIDLLMFAVIILFGLLMPAPSAEGRKLLDEIEGLKLYLSVAEVDDLKRLQAPGEAPMLDGKRYEALLPYAVALDVEEAWTKKFTAAVGEAVAAQTASNLSWYRGTGINSLSQFSSSLNSSFNSSIASASSPPGSSSGGGGFSGGGGGGGGGGGR